MGNTVSVENELYEAIQRNQLSTFKAILSKDEVRYDGNVKKLEWELLHTVAHYGRDAMIDILLEAGIDIDRKLAGSGRCPLHCAVEGNSLPAVKKLLEQGADHTLKADSKSKGLSGTPLDWAKQLNYVRIIRALEEHKAQQELALKDLQDKATIQKEYEEANQVQGKIQQKQEEIETIQKKLKRMDHMKIELEKRREYISDEIDYLRLLPSYRSNGLLNQLRRKLDGIETLAASLRGLVVVTSPSNEGNDSRNCPICLLPPQQVYSCERMDYWFCERCKGRMVEKKCPICNDDFLTNPPRRNYAMEQLLGI